MYKSGERERKGHPVAMMGSIYEMAGQVITYLGPEEQHDQEAVTLIMKIYRQFKMYFKGLDYMIMISEVNEEIEKEALSLYIDIATSGVSSLDAILNGPWTEIMDGSRKQYQ